MRHLKGITRDLEAAREADVTRHIIMQLGRNRRGRMNSNSRELYERAVKRYESATYGLRMTIAADPWRQRLTDLGRLSVLSSLVKENDDLAATVMYRLVKRHRRRLRRKLSKVGRSPKRLHRVRLRVKAIRYILEGCLSNSVIRGNFELKCLRQLQNCLGDMHDEENLLKALRTERRRHEAARDIARKLEDRKSRHLHAFKAYRKALMRVWHSAAFSTVQSGEML
jgi:CHAD domain-containing protein